MGVVFGVLASAGAAAVSRAPTVDAPAAEQRARPAAPVASVSPTPSESPDQSGHSEGQAPARTAPPVTEHHEFHGSGSVGVVSGSVDQGTKAGGSQGSVVGARHSPRP